MTRTIYAAMHKQSGTIDSRTMTYFRQDVDWLIAKNGLNSRDYEIVEA